MQLIQLEIKDDYADKVINFLKLLPSNVAKINISKSLKSEENLSDELVSRIEDVKNNNIKTISRDELFDGV